MEGSMRKQAVKQVIENNELENALEALGKSIARWNDKRDKFETAIQGLTLFRADEPSEPVSIMYDPRVCVIAQGAKRVVLGDETFVYDVQIGRASCRERV